jgi:hypothetical protein
MSMLGMQADELRKTAGMAANLNDFERVSVPWMRNKLAPMLREAADTIISLRDRLQAVQGVGDETNYDKLFGTPERAARTMIAVHGECETSKSCYPDCPFGAAPTCPRDCWSDDYDALLGWLRGDA